MMKRGLLSILLLTIATIGFAQRGETALIAKGGYNTHNEHSGFGIGGRTNIVKNVRLGVDAMYYGKQENVMALNINVDLQYVFRPFKRFFIFPFAGFSMRNTHFEPSKDIDPVTGKVAQGDGNTDEGLNLGLGMSYYFNDRFFINSESKYIAGIKSTSIFTLGFGVVFGKVKKL